MNPNLEADGFGIYFGNFCKIGFWSKNEMNGNGMILNGKTFQVFEQGWFKDSFLQEESVEGQNQD